MNQFSSALIASILFIAPLVALSDFLEPTPAYCGIPTVTYLPYYYSPCPPSKSCLDGLYVFGEYLYWKADMDNTAFCTVDNTLTTNADPTSNPPYLTPDAHGKYHFAELNWNSGVRGGIGIPLPRDNWELIGSYTYHYSDGHQRVNRPANPDFVIIGMFRENVLNYLEYADSNINLKYEQADLLLSRCYHPSQYTRLKLYMGLTGGYFDQHWTIKYSALSSEFPVNINTVKNDWKYYGGGGRVGIDFGWNLGCGISILGKCTGAIVAGRYKHHYHAINPNNSTYPTGDADYGVLRYVPNTQVNAGLEWERLFCGVKVGMQLLYELNCWWNVNPLPVTPYIPSSGSTAVGNSERFTFNRNGNICFQGLTGRLGFKF